MARRAEGLKVQWRNGIGYARFTWQGQRFQLSTGESDPRKAQGEAERLYAGVVAGKLSNKKKAAHAVRAPLDAVMADWLASLEGVLDQRTVETYMLYVRSHFLPWFERLDKLTEAHVAEYGRARLRKVKRRTMQKELGALGGFLRWAKEQGFIAEVPAFPVFPRTSKGVRAGKQREKARELTREEVDRILDALPVWSERKTKTRNGKTGAKFLVRARFVVAFDTTLRPATIDALTKGVHAKPPYKVLHIPDADDKARRGRDVPLTKRARAAIRAAADEVAEGEPLFGVHDYRTALRKAAQAAKVPYASVCAYDLRHARITELVERSGNLPGVMHMAGHTQIGTTSKYTHPSRRAAEAVLEGETEDET